MNNKMKGFTLVELMIVVAIIGILAAVAIPSYQQYMMKARRSDAQDALTAMAAAQQRYYSNNQYVYTDDETLIGGVNSNEGYYTLEVTVLSADRDAFTLTATPAAGSPQQIDAACMAITLTSTGVKAPAACW